MLTLRRFYRQPLLVVTLLAFATLACGLFGQTPTPPPATDTPVSATGTPVPSPTPLPPQPPVIADRYPLNGELLPTTGAIDIYFDQAMDQDSITAAFNIEPAIEGRLEWMDTSTLRFIPDQPLDEAARYTVTIGDAASSAAGLKLTSPFSFTVETTGFFLVSDVIPAADSTDVDPTAPITVVFNQPVVPLGLGLLTSETLPSPLRFNPPVDGTGEWINTSIYQFTPAIGFVGGTTYTASVDPALRDANDTLLSETFEWQFTTRPPDVVELYPTPDQVDVPLDAELVVRFNQPMDATSTAAAFQLATLSGNPISGTFEWNETQDEFTFTPAGLLPLGASLRVTLGESARSLAGNASLPSIITWDFFTVPAPAILNSEPPNGQLNVEPGPNNIRVSVTAPLAEDTLAGNITVTPSPANLEIFFASYNNSIFISWSFEPRTAYTVTFGADIADPYGNTLGQPTTLTFTTGDYEPFNALNVTSYASYHRAGQPQRLFVTYRNINRLDFALQRLSPADFYNLVQPDNYTFRNEFTITNPIRTWTVTPEAFLNEGAYLEVVMTEDGSSLPPGAYYLEMVSPADDAKHLLVVSNTNITLKQTMDEALVWLTDLETGAPVPNTPITFLNENMDAIGTATTDADGLARFTLPNRLSYIVSPIGAVVQTETDFAFAVSEWDNGVQPYEFGFSQQYAPEDRRIYLYTDRPIYRPGQTVELKGIVRAEDDVRYSLPPEQSVRLVVYNDFYEAILERTIPLTEFGTFAESIELSEAASTGYYTIEISLNSDNSRSLGFQVAEYRRPEFQVAVTPSAAEVADGEEIIFTVDASYFFGGPVANADVSWNVVSRDYYFRWDGPGYYDWTNDPTSFTYSFDPFGFSFGESIADGTGRTNSQGQLEVTLAADLSRFNQSQVYTFEAVVTEAADQPIAGRVSVIVHQGRVYVGLAPQSYIANAGADSAIDLRVVDWQQQAIANQSVEVIFYQREYFSVQEEDDFGNLIWTVTTEDTEVDRATVTTNATGQATASYSPPNGGTYRILAETRDSNGRTVRADVLQWVSDPASYVNWRQDTTNRIELIANQQSYRPGDAAEILIPSPFQEPVQALITIERGRFFQSEVITLESNSTVYRLPITADFAPNVYVSVTIIAGVSETNPAPALRAGLINLPVSTEQQELNLTLSPSSDITGPGDTLTYTLTATDYAGNPVQGEFSLALVDLAVLSLADDFSQPILDAFYGERALGVNTASSLLVALDAINLEIAESKGGGGGGGDAAFFDLRSEFRDTAYWNAFVTTNASGQAEVEITLPDNLTTWRMDARGLTADNLVGQTTVDIIATKPLLIRPLTPRFFVVGDQPTVAAVVNNNTGADLTVDVVLAADGLRLTGPATQTITVANGEQVRVDWSVEVDDVSVVDLTFSVSGGGYQDASKPPLGQAPDQLLPVYRYISPDTVGTSGILTEPGEETEVIALPRRFDASEGELQLTMSASLGAALLDALDTLEPYPGESTEYTISRLFSNAVTQRTLQQLTATDPGLEARLRSLNEQAIQKLVSEQHADGGWGWYIAAPSNNLLTAYALFALYHARDAGLAVPDTTISNAIEFVRPSAYAVGERPAGLAQTTSNRSLYNRQAFMLYTLALYDEADVSMLNYVYDFAGQMSYYGWAYLALAYGEVDPQNANLGVLINDLSSAVVLSATGGQWTEEEHDLLNLNTDLHSTSVILSALARRDSENSLLPQVVRWLMVARTAERGWSTPYETAWTIRGLTDYMVATGELNANYPFGVALNNAALAEGVFGPDNLTETQQVTLPIRDLPTGQASRVTFAHGDGAGTLYYTAFLSVYRDVPSLPAQNRGLIVSRVYTQPDANCGGQRQPACPPVDSVSVGDQMLVTLTLVVPNDAYFVTLTDTIPAGFEVVDTTLNTTSQQAEGPAIAPTTFDYYGWGWWWFTNTDIRDEGVTLFAEYLPAGTYTFTYRLNASLAGTYNVLPAIAQQTYFPDVYGRTTGQSFTIEP